MSTLLGAGAFMAAAAGLYWLMAIMGRTAAGDWRGAMVAQIEKRSGTKWHLI